MPKSRWSGSFNSFIGSYVDPEKVEELRETKAEIDGKVKKILESLEENEDGSKETVAGLIEDLNNHYQSLYSRYDHLIEKLSEKAQGKNGKDSSSSDSSDSDFSPRETGNKNGHVESSTAVIEQELETALSEVGDLRGKLASTLDEKETLYLEHQTVLTENMGLKLEINKLAEEITLLDESNEELKAELEMKSDEISTLIDNMRVTEVSQRLTSRKLCVTEQVLGEKEESHQMKVDNLLEQQKFLEEKIAAYKESQVETKKEVSEKVTESITGIDNLSVKFEEDYGHLESRVYEIVNELKVVVNWIALNNSEKDRLKKELADMLQQLKDQKAILRHEEDEKRSLIQTVRGLEGKASEMEVRIEERDREMRGKDDRILSLCEEKREAIKQLCICIDYHHSRLLRRSHASA